MILLSLALVVASVGTLVGGLATSSSPLVWTSLGAGLTAVALVAGSVARRRTRLPTSATAPSGSAPATPSLSSSPAAPPGAGSRRVPLDLPTAGGVFPGDRLPAPPPPPPATAPTGSVTVGDQPEIIVTTGTPGTEERDTPSRRDTPKIPGRHSEPPAMPPEPPTAPEGPAPAGTDARTAQSADTRTEQLSEPDATPLGGPGEPPVEDVPVVDALRVAQLANPVTVRDGHPRYHLADCPTLAGASDPTELPVSAARRSGFTPCAICGPDRALLARSRHRPPG